VDQRVAHRLKVVEAAGADKARNAAHFCFFRYLAIQIDRFLD
jgi:hypothetical protein